MDVLVNEKYKEITSIYDDKGVDITLDFLKKTVDTVAEYHNQRQNEDNDWFWESAEYEDLPSTSMIADLPPSEVEDEIKFNAQTNVIEMSSDAFDWWQQYAPKHNEVSALEAKTLPYISNDADDDYYYSRCTDYRASDTINLNGAVNTKSEWLRDYAIKNGIDIDGIEKIPDLPQELRTIIDDLRDKVNAEFESFIADMKQQPPEAIIESAYEITWKGNINRFIRNDALLPDDKQLNALLGSTNTLDEIYDEWLTNGELETYENIQIALDDTAKHILLSLERSNNTELTAKHQEKATALVNGELKELPAVIDSQDKDITLDFLKETVNTVAKYNNQRQNEDKDPVWQFTEYEDLPSTSLISRLPPFEVEDEIRFNADSNQIEMSQAAFDWFEQYAPKHNDVSALEGQLLKHMRALDALETYELADTEGYRWSGAANLDETAEFKKERLQDFAKKHSIELSSDKEQSKAAEAEKPRKLSLSERIDKARAENPRVDAPKQVQQRSNSSQEL